MPPCTTTSTHIQVLKWNFTAPRPEYVQQLQDQARTCVGRGLLAAMFGEDFRGHLRALEAWSDAAKAPDAAATVLPNLDIVLRWVTLRFFDTNTAVLLRTLQLLQELCDLAAASKHEMVEYEAAAFLPYLVGKVFCLQLSSDCQLGDKIESVRKDTHTLLRTLCRGTYPPAKMFAYIMEVRAWAWGGW